jgi:ParB family chromosome partitioning protein
MDRISLDPGRIDLADERFRTSFFGSREKLAFSIKRVGLLHPPLVTRLDGRWVLVSGWKRVLACRDLGLAAIDAFDTGEKDALKNFLLGFLENLGAREFGLVEKAEILARLAAFGEKREALIKDDMPLLDLARNEDILRAMLEISGFSAAIKKGLEEMSAPFPVARQLTLFSPEERAAVLPHLLPLGRNKQKEVLENLWEVTRRDRVSVMDVLASQPVREVMEAGSLSGLQRSEGLRHELRRMRFPAVSRREEDFEKTVRGLDIPREVGLTPPAFFEKNEVRMSFSVRSPEALRSILDRLGRLAHDEHFRALFEWLK